VSKLRAHYGCTDKYLTIPRTLDIAIYSTLLVKVLSTYNVGLYIPEQCMSLFKVQRQVGGTSPRATYMAA